MMTFKDILFIRKDKYNKHINTAKSDYCNGYEDGWRNAYQDIIDILEQTNFDLNAYVFSNTQEV